MPEPTIVWAVDLERGSSLQEVTGTLTLAPDALEFQPRDERLPLRRIELDHVRKVKRLRASPVLMVVHERDARRVQTAFYFAQPPPIDPKPSPPATPLSFGRQTKRKARRQAVGYLATTNQRKKEEVREWEGAVRDAIARRC